MGAAENLKDLRKHIRYKTEEKSHKHPGEIYSVAGKRKISYFVKDYSTGGLGIVTLDKMLPDLDFILLTKSEEGKSGTVNLSVIWGMSCNDGSDNYRYGLKVTGGDTTLTEIYRGNPKVS